MLNTTNYECIYVNMKTDKKINDWKSQRQHITFFVLNPLTSPNIGVILEYISVSQKLCLQTQLNSVFDPEQNLKSGWSSKLTNNHQHIY